MRCWRCGSTRWEDLGIAIPTQFGGGGTVVRVCVICGEKFNEDVAEGKTPVMSALLDEAEAAIASGAPEEQILSVLLRRPFEAGVVLGVVKASRALAEKITFKGRLKRIRALWPPDTEEKMQEISALLLLGDHHGS